MSRSSAVNKPLCGVPLSPVFEPNPRSFQILWLRFFSDAILRGELPAAVLLFDIRVELGVLVFLMPLLLTPRTLGVPLFVNLTTFFSGELLRSHSSVRESGLMRWVWRRAAREELTVVVVGV